MSTKHPHTFVTVKVPDVEDGREINKEVDIIYTDGYIVVGSYEVTYCSWEISSGLLLHGRSFSKDCQIPPDQVEAILAAARQKGFLLPNTERSFVKMFAPEYVYKLPTPTPPPDPPDSWADFIRGIERLAGIRVNASSTYPLRVTTTMHRVNGPQGVVWETQVLLNNLPQLQVASSGLSQALTALSNQSRMRTNEAIVHARAQVQKAEKECDELRAKLADLELDAGATK